MDGETCMRTSPLNTPLLLVALLCLWVGPVFVSCVSVPVSGAVSVAVSVAEPVLSLCRFESVGH